MKLEPLRSQGFVYHIGDLIAHFECALALRQADQAIDSAPQTAHDGSMSLSAAMVHAVNADLTDARLLANTGTFAIVTKTPVQDYTGRGITSSDNPPRNLRDMLMDLPPTVHQIAGRDLVII